MFNFLFAVVAFIVGSGFLMIGTQFIVGNPLGMEDKLPVSTTIQILDYLIVWGIGAAIVVSVLGEKIGSLVASLWTALGLALVGFVSFEEGGMEITMPVIGYGVGALVSLVVGIKLAFSKSTKWKGELAEELYKKSEKEDKPSKGKKGVGAGTVLGAAAAGYAASQMNNPPTLSSDDVDFKILKTKSKGNGQWEFKLEIKDPDFSEPVHRTMTVPNKKQIFSLGEWNIKVEKS